jgi:dTDP-4-dehydrorhamnose 3,5-epimerase-like enzyme
LRANGRTYNPKPLRASISKNLQPGRSITAHSCHEAIPAIINFHMPIKISELPNHGDARGFSFTMPSEAIDFVGRVADIHLAATVPGAVRGNHYHLRRREAIVLLPGTKWSLHWDEGEGTTTQQRNFDGGSAVLVLVSTGASHAVRNDGATPLWLVACSSEPYDPTETVVRKVV